jgi:hypothetical protein
MLSPTVAWKQPGSAWCSQLSSEYGKNWRTVWTLISSTAISLPKGKQQKIRLVTAVVGKSDEFIALL